MSSSQSDPYADIMGGCVFLNLYTILIYANIAQVSL